MYHVVDNFELKLLCLKINSRIGPIPCWESVKCTAKKTTTFKWQRHAKRRNANCQWNVYCIKRTMLQAIHNVGFCKLYSNFTKCKFLKVECMWSHFKQLYMFACLWLVLLCMLASWQLKSKIKIRNTNIVQEFTLCYYPQNQNDFWQRVGLLSTLTDPVEHFVIKWGKVYVVGIIYPPDWNRVNVFIYIVKVNGEK